MLAARRADRLEATVQELVADGAEVVGVPTDVADMAQVEELARRAVDTFGRVDIALLNAGVSGADDLLNPDLDAWRTQVEVNLFGLLHGIKAFVPRMLAQGGPAAVYATSSGAGVHGTTYRTAPYAATKSAQLTIMESLYGQLRDAGAPLTVGIVLPPLTRTNLVGDDLSVWGHVQRLLGGAEGDAALIEPEEFAPVVVDGIEAGRFWIEASDADDVAYFGGRYATEIRRSQGLTSAKARALVSHEPPDSYLW